IFGTKKHIPKTSDTTQNKGLLALPTKASNPFYGHCLTDSGNAASLFCFQWPNKWLKGSIQQKDNSTFQTAEANYFRS
ncbi:MAG: hypothetical protein KDD09_26360, partial [Phaeodactylibacter sp.]|nr:hypothetical protein [Phaeodactylibacter sp.]